MAVRQEASTGELVDDGQAAPTSEKPTMSVKVYSPYKVYFDQPAYSISGMNGTGPFDILPHHHNFITLLLACELVLQTETGQIKIKIGGGVMHVKADQVTVFLDV
jgi:F0F1-type ATP synthase epsilon subunit